MKRAVAIRIYLAQGRWWQLAARTTGRAVSSQDSCWCALESSGAQSAEGTEHICTALKHRPTRGFAAIKILGTCTPRSCARVPP